ncbi:hypothetical protein Sjap_025769 [Stephania japonica]|uniref:Uncharacterized protein n=1 Tax=Stephania japonica TaxID=461633 RepID=A0AAP0EA39_9MAGN
MGQLIKCCLDKKVLIKFWFTPFGFLSLMLEFYTRAKKWAQELQKQGNPNMVIALAGNKDDLEHQERF